MKAMMLVALMMSSTLAFSASNYFDKNERCLQVNDLKEIKNDFKQFRKYADLNQPEVCVHEMTKDDFETARVLLALKKLKVKTPFARDLNDDFTRTPITASSWWDYFKKRAHTFVYRPDKCKAEDGSILTVVAFVQVYYMAGPDGKPILGPDGKPILAPNNPKEGIVNLCPRFFDNSTVEQIATLLHEVRHFEGHGHVTCSRGFEAGQKGACDETITSGGSYAVSVQAEVTLSFNEQLSKQDRDIAEATAIYRMYNKFNKQPKLKTTDYLYLGDQDGGIHRWKIGSNKRTDKLFDFGRAVRVFSSSNGDILNVFPVNVNYESRRVTKDFKGQYRTNGMFGQFYNQITPAQRRDIVAINHYGQMGLVMNDKILTLCGNQPGAFDFPHESIKTLVDLRDKSGVETMYVMGVSGKLYSAACTATTPFVSKATSIELPTDTQQALSVDEKTTYILNDAGEVRAYDMKTKTLSDNLFKILGRDIVSITTSKAYTFFENN